jgi:hypothetical protein
VIAPWRLKSLRAGCIAALICLSHSNVGRAQDSAAAAESLFNDAREAMSRKDFGAACDKFRESDRLDPAVGTRFNLANCEEQRGQLATAWALYRQVIEKLAAEDPRLPIAKERSRALDARVPRLTIRARQELPAGTKITVAGLMLGTASLGSSMPLNPGTYRVSIGSPGKPTQELTVTLAEGDAADVAVPLGSSAIPAARPNSAADQASESDSQSADEDVRDNRKLLAYAVGGVGATALAVGIVTGLTGLHKESIGNADCSDVTRTCTQSGHDANQSARSLATVSTIGFAAGILGVGLGSYFWLTLPDVKATTIGVSHAEGATLLNWKTRW